jgi:rhodanese-related sulfurtransferase
VAEEFAVISRDELLAKLKANHKFTLIETLPKVAYEHAHLPQALNIPLEDLREMVPRLVPSVWDEIVVYCASPT